MAGPQHFQEKIGRNLEAFSGYTPEQFSAAYDLMKAGNEFSENARQIYGQLTGKELTPINAEITALIRRMTAMNPLWGAPRIHGELRKLGIEVAERTVSRLMPKRRAPPSQTWRTFLANHVRDLVSLDFFTVPTAGWRVLFVFLVLAHHRRRVVQIP